MQDGEPYICGAIVDFLCSQRIQILSENEDDSCPKYAVETNSYGWSINWGCNKFYLM